MLRVSIAGRPSGWDPHITPEALTLAVLGNVFEGLTRFDAQMRIQPLLAERWESPDELTWIFHLRAGVVFHDGRPLQAEDVSFSLGRAKSHPTVGGDAPRSSVNTISAADERSIEIRTPRPVANLPALLALVAVIPRDSPEAIRRPVGTGPFQYSSEENGGVELEAFQRYWRPASDWTKVRFRFEEDQRPLVTAMLDDDLDIIWRLQPQYVRLLDGADCCLVESRAGFTVQVLSLNVRKKPFDDRRVREAINLAIDRTALVRAVRAGHAEPVGQFASPEALGYAPELHPVTADPARARALLRAAGHADGLAFPIMHREGFEIEPQLEQLAAVGLEVRSEAYPWSEIAPR